MLRKKSKNYINLNNEHLSDGDSTNFLMSNGVLDKIVEADIEFFETEVDRFKEQL